MKDLRCNACGQIIKHDGSVFVEDALVVTKEWGYFSKKDGKRHRFCLCESCYDKMIENFNIPVDLEDVTEYM